MYFSAPPLIQRNWKLPEVKRGSSKVSTPVGPASELNDYQLAGETLHILRPLAHCILNKTTTPLLNSCSPPLHKG